MFYFSGIHGPFIFKELTTRYGSGSDYSSDHNYISDYSSLNQEYELQLERDREDAADEARRSNRSRAEIDYLDDAADRDSLDRRVADHRNGYFSEDDD